MSSKHLFNLDVLWVLVLVVILLACILPCPLGIVWYYNLDGPTRQQGEAGAAPLVAALQRYKDENGLYPASLKELVPKYSPSIPRPGWRHAYYYDTSDDRSQFSINFDEKGEALGDGFCGYSSSSRAWQCTDSLMVSPYD